jgi:hypothetical protein
MVHSNAISYVESLLKRLSQLKAEQAASYGLLDISRSDIHRDAPQHNQSHPGSETSSSPQPKNTSFDVHCLIETNGTPTLRFFGSSSAMALTVELVRQVCTAGILLPATKVPLYLHPPNDIPEIYSEPNYSSLLSRDALVPLIKLYLSSLNLIYPFLDETAIYEDLETVLLGRHPETPGSTILTGNHAYQYFSITMICANACAVKSRHESHFTAIGNAYYNEALRHVEQVTSEESALSLQSLLLLITYSLFYPQKGDIWKLLDFACRLSVELGYHREQDLGLYDNQQVERGKDLRRSCFWSLYTIERIVGQLFGRISDLPEPIITAEYPAHSNDREEVLVQLVSATHHNRLVYLRSEIYRHMYLPTNPPLDNLEWFQDQFYTLRQWHHELDLEKYAPGVSTVTCTVAYHATIIFLFQPLILRSLSITDSATGTDKITMVPSDNYYSACKLIKTYEQVLQAPESSCLGSYPMTFMSAHYIYIAGLTLMAHCLLRLNGSLTVLAPWSDVAHDNPVFQINFGSLFESSTSCLILLTWCAERWRGMSGMLDTFKRLSEALLPMMARSLPFPT